MMIPLNAISIPISRVGLGKDIWNVHPDDITDFLYVSSLVISMIQTPNKGHSSSSGMNFSTSEFSPSRKSPSYSSTSRCSQAKTSD
jgi:hypothetical protein